ncbi:hypothetical protein EDD18DRAFT_1335771 [Armillaria luteobubalina]|uniref:Uncharacterized protein n=1 Tax=Armillaria luteobubalina TaxID=153913 RepID=A0AA39UN46_9AGAR|nr:hypothetical protein EDD18DRAFT_1335771 [Armillaria luteobubalina]
MGRNVSTKEHHSSLLGFTPFSQADFFGTLSAACYEKRGARTDIVGIILALYELRPILACGNAVLTRIEQGYSLKCHVSMSQETRECCGKKMYQTQKQDSQIFAREN